MAPHTPPTLGTPRRSRGAPRHAFRTPVMPRPSSRAPDPDDGTRSGLGDDHDGVAAGFHSDAIADAEDAVAERAGQLHADELAGADVDLVEMARPLEDTERDDTGQAGAAGFGRLRER